jgi:predicted RNase H-like HicB family nuclease
MFRKLLSLLVRYAGFQSIRLTISAVVEPDGDGFHAYCPALKGLHADGKTEKEAMINVAELALLYIESLSKHGDPLPIGPDLTIQAEPTPIHIPAGAVRENLTLQWPCHQAFGVN